METVKTSAAAVCSMVLGIVSLLFCLGPLAGIPAVICGHVARGNIRGSGGTLRGEGMAVAGLIMGYIGSVIILFAIIAIAAFGVLGDRIREKVGAASVELQNAPDAAVDNATETKSADWLKSLDKTGAR
jgi:hypothetical protein